MVGLWILGVLAALILLLCLLRVGIRVVLADGSAAVDVRLSWFHIRVYPAKKQAGKEERQKAKKSGEGTKKPLPKIGLEDIRDGVGTLWPPLKRALRRTRRGIRIAPLALYVTLGGADDPAGTAELYGYLHAGVWTAMPALERVLEIRDPYIHIGMDFNTPKARVEGEIGVTARVGTLLAAGLSVGIPALRWFLRYRKKTKKQQPAAQPAA